MASLFLLPSLAQAGTYVWTITDPDPTKSTESPVYSGGAIHYNYPDGTLHDESYTKLTSSPVLYGNSIDEGVNPDCSGAITTTFTWHADSGQTAATDPPPKTVIVTEVCHVSVFSAFNTTAPVVGICDTGLGVSSALAQSQSPSGGAIGSADLTATRYTAAPGGKTVTISCSPRAQCIGTFPTVQVRYTASISPVFVSPGGLTTDPITNSLKVLTGQQITGSLSGIPFGPGPGSTYQWRVWHINPNPRLPIHVADVFFNYDPNDPNFHQLTLLGDAPGHDQASTLTFYGKTEEGIVINCSANLIAPDGKSLAINVTSVPIAVLKPKVANWGIETGYVRPVFSIGRNLGGFQLLANPDSGNPSGEYWRNVTIDVPQPFVGGTGAFAQLITPSTLTYQNGKPPAPIAGDNTQGLDNIFPYDSWELPAKGNQGDSPAAYDTNLNFGVDQGYRKVMVHDQFTTWVMYKPPPKDKQGVVFVPLQSYNWDWSFTSQWLQNMWRLTASNPAIPTAAISTPVYKGAMTNDYPTWKVVHGNAP